MLMQAIAASKGAATNARRRREPCKRHANCLKHKEIPYHSFDLPLALNYLKVKRSPEVGRRQDDA